MRVYCNDRLCLTMQGRGITLLCLLAHLLEKLHGDSSGAKLTLCGITSRPSRDKTRSVAAMFKDLCVNREHRKSSICPLDSKSTQSAWYFVDGKTFFFFA